MQCQSYFLRKIRKNISKMSSAEMLTLHAKVNPLLLQLRNAGTFYKIEPCNTKQGLFGV